MNTPFRGRYMKDDKLPYVLRPLYDAHNSLGWKGKEFSIARQPGRKRVICVGTSTTYGGTHPYPEWLEKFLVRAGLQVEVFNAGVPGWTSRELLIDFRERVLPLKPDLIVLYEGRNDLIPQAYNRFRPDYSHFRDPDGDFTRSHYWFKTLFKVSRLSLMVVLAKPKLFAGTSWVPEYWSDSEAATRAWASAWAGDCAAAKWCCWRGLWARARRSSRKAWRRHSACRRRSSRRPSRWRCATTGACRSCTTTCIGVQRPRRTARDRLPGIRRSRDSGPGRVGRSRHRARTVPCTVSPHVEARRPRRIRSRASISTIQGSRRRSVSHCTSPKRGVRSPSSPTTGSSLATEFAGPRRQGAGPAAGDRRLLARAETTLAEPRRDRRDDRAGQFHRHPHRARDRAGAGVARGAAGCSPATVCGRGRRPRAGRAGRGASSTRGAARSTRRCTIVPERRPSQVRMAPRCVRTGGRQPPRSRGRRRGRSVFDGGKRRRARRPGAARRRCRATPAPRAPVRSPRRSLDLVRRGAVASLAGRGPRTGLPAVVGC